MRNYTKKVFNIGPRPLPTSTFTMCTTLSINTLPKRPTVNLEQLNPPKNLGPKDSSTFRESSKESSSLSSSLGKDPGVKVEKLFFLRHRPKRLNKLECLFRPRLKFARKAWSLPYKWSASKVLHSGNLRP